MFGDRSDLTKQIQSSTTFFFSLCLRPTLVTQPSSAPDVILDLTNCENCINTTDDDSPHSNKSFTGFYTDNISNCWLKVWCWCDGVNCVDVAGCCCQSDLWPLSRCCGSTSQWHTSVRRVCQTEKRGYEVENKCFRVNLLLVSLQCVKKYMNFNLIYVVIYLALHICTYMENNYSQRTR